MKRKNNLELKQSDVIFHSENHKYVAPDGRVLQGITGMINKHLFPDKYSNVPEEVLQKKAEKGSAIHASCRAYDMFGVLDDLSAPYAVLKEREGIVTLDNEYIVSDNEHFATAIDVVGEDFSLYDIKTTYSLDKDYLSWQLSVCAYLFEKQNGFPAGNLFGIWITDKTTELVPVKRIDDKYIEELLDCEINGLPFVNPLTDVPATMEQSIEKAYQLETLIKEKEEELKQIKADMENVKEFLLSEMEKNGVKKWETDNILVTYVAPSFRQTLDTTKLKEEKPDIYSLYLKETETKSYVKIKIR